MNPELISLPFYVSQVLYRVYGLLRLESGRLVIEYQTVENIVGMVRGPLRSVSIPLREIASVDLNKASFGGRQLDLRLLYLHSLRKFPGVYDGVCQLRIRRNNVLLAQEFVNRLELLLSEEALRQLENPRLNYAESQIPYQQLPESKIEHLQKVWEGIKGLLK